MKIIKALTILLLTISQHARGDITAPPPLTNQPKNEAKKPGAAKFSLQLPLLKFSMNSIRTESSAGSSNEKKNELSTQILEDGYIGMTLGKLGLYIYPFDDGNHFVSAGYMITESIELGADLGLNEDSTLIGAWGYYYWPLGLMVLENGLSITSQSQTDKNPPNPDIKSEEFSFKVTSNVTYPLARNLKYIGGAFIRNTSQEADGGAKTSNFQIGFILAGIRLKWI